MNPTQHQKSKYYPIGEAAKLLNVSIKTLRRWDSSGVLRSTRNERNQRLFNIAELEHFKTTQNTNPQIYSITQAANYLKLSVKTLRRWEKAGRIKAYRNERNQRVFMAADIHQAKQAALTSLSFHSTQSTYNILRPLVAICLIFIPTLIYLKNSPRLDLLNQTLSNPPLSIVSSVLPTPTPMPYQNLNSSTLKLASQDLQHDAENLPHQDLLENDSLRIEAPPNPSTLSQLSNQYNIISNINDLNSNFDTIINQSDSTTSAQLMIALLSTAQELLNIYKDVVIPQNLLEFTNNQNSLEPISLASSAASINKSYLNQYGNFVQSTEIEAIEKVESEGTLHGNEVLAAGLSQSTYPLPKNYNADYFNLHLIFTSDYAPASRYWITQQEDSFTLYLDSPISTPASFNWIALPR